MLGARRVTCAPSSALGDPPATVMTAVDRALRDLQVGALATAVLATVEQTAEQRQAGLRTLRWTNAGHLPPVLLEPDGTRRLLTSDPDLLLGLDPATARADHSVALQPGSTVLLYTDGGADRRSRSRGDQAPWLVVPGRGRFGRTGRAGPVLRAPATTCLRRLSPLSPDSDGS